MLSPSCGPCIPCPSVLCALPLPQPATYTVSHSLLYQLLLKHIASHCKQDHPVQAIEVYCFTLMTHIPQPFDLYPPTPLLKHHCLHMGSHEPPALCRLAWLPRLVLLAWLLSSRWFSGKPLFHLLTFALCSSLNACLVTLPLSVHSQLL